MTPEESQFEREKFQRLVSLENRVAALEAQMDVKPFQPHPAAGEAAPVIPIGKAAVSDTDVIAEQKGEALPVEELVAETPVEPVGVAEPAKEEEAPADQPPVE